MKYYYTIYKTINLINSKVYIGCHKTMNLEDDYLGSGLILKRAIEKHGKDNFEKEILHVFDSPEEMFEMESTLVNKDFISLDSNYNLKLGGEGGWDYVNSLPVDIQQRVLAGKASGLKFKERFNNDSEFRRKMVTQFFDCCEKGHKALKEKYPNGTFFGKKHSEESKQKMSLAAKNRKGSKNHSFGTCWIHSLREEKSKKINKSDLEIWISKGWLKGRKLKFK